MFFENLKSGSPASGSDSPDGSIVEKGGVAQQLRISYLNGAGSRKVYTLPATGTAADTPLSDYTFTSSNSSVSSAFNTDEIAWVRGEANVASGPGAEEFVGAFKDNAGVVKNLGTTGARHSIHGDVLHSRPVAINYGTKGVVVYYGANDHLYGTMNGSKTGTTGGDELWSFIAPEHYAMLKRQRGGTPLLHLPETNSDGTLEPTLLNAEPKNYAFNGPIGSYVLYNSGSTAVTEAMIYASMRRGGKAVYAFNVTNPANPKFKWKIESSGSFSDLAQTWSMAKPIVYKSTSGAAGGGHDGRRLRRRRGGERRERDRHAGRQSGLLHQRAHRSLAQVRHDRLLGCGRRDGPRHHGGRHSGPGLRRQRARQRLPDRPADQR